MDIKSSVSGTEPRTPVDINKAYMLASIPALLGFAGVHKFYMGDPKSGLLYFFTWGLFGVGTVRDLLKMPQLVESYNRTAAPQDPRAGTKIPCRYCGVPGNQTDSTCASCGGY